MPKSMKAMSEVTWQRMQRDRRNASERDRHNDTCLLAAEIQRTCPGATRSEALREAHRIITGG